MGLVEILKLRKESLVNREVKLKSLRIEELLQKGKEYFNRGEYKKSLMMFNEIVEVGNVEKRTLAETYFHLANIFHLKGEIGKAIKAFNKVLNLEPSHTDASISLSVLYNDIGRYDEAKKIFEKANERVKTGSATLGNVEDQHINKKFSNKHYELAEMYMTYQRFDEALFEYNKSIKLDPTNLEARLKIAKVYAKKNFLNKALDELKKLKNEFPSYLPARNALGVLYYGSGCILEAQSEWERVISKDPRNQEANMYMNLSKTATETSIYTKSKVEIKPEEGLQSI